MNLGGVTVEPIKVTPSTKEFAVVTNVAVNGHEIRHEMNSSTARTAWTIDYSLLSSTDYATLKGLVGKTTTLDSTNVIVKSVNGNEYYDALGNLYYDATVTVEEVV
jgi:hypothetical protein